MVVVVGRWPRDGGGGGTVVMVHGEGSAGRMHGARACPRSGVYRKGPIGCS